MPRETDLYPPLKAFFEARGHVVKAEIGAADLVAVGDGGGDPVVVEMKLRFSLALYHQAIDRLRLTPQVYVAVPLPEGPAARRMLADNVAMCRRLGLGLLTVRAGLVELPCRAGGAPAAGGAEAAQDAAGRVRAAAGRPQRRWRDPPRAGHRLSAGRAALRRVPGRVRRLARRGGGARHRGEGGDADHGGQPLWLVRPCRRRGLRPDRGRDRRPGRLGRRAARGLGAVPKTGRIGAWPGSPVRLWRPAGAAAKLAPTTRRPR